MIDCTSFAPRTILQLLARAGRTRWLKYLPTEGGFHLNPDWKSMSLRDADVLFRASLKSGSIRDLNANNLCYWYGVSRLLAEGPKWFYPTVDMCRAMEKTYDPAQMTEVEAEEILATYQYFDYLRGRVMKLDFSKESIDPRLYDRDNGSGAAQLAIDAMAKGDYAAIKEMHKDGVLEAGLEASAGMAHETKIEKDKVTLGLGDVEDVLKPKVDEAMKRIL